mmetsp:Transcript_41342/g.118173  ORF Transcript_41342/g.118173 Transcript_41342/m.118173 type:complete len:231 (+) Transcript_41342:199-891(+)
MFDVGLGLGIELLEVALGDAGSDAGWLLLLGSRLARRLPGRCRVPGGQGSSEVGHFACGVTLLQQLRAHERRQHHHGERKASDHEGKRVVVEHELRRLLSGWHAHELRARVLVRTTDDATKHGELLRWLLRLLRLLMLLLRRNHHDGSTSRRHEAEHCQDMRMHPKGARLLSCHGSGHDLLAAVSVLANHALLNALQAAVGLHRLGAGLLNLLVHLAVRAARPRAHERFR